MAKSTIVKTTEGEQVTEKVSENVVSEKVSTPISLESIAKELENLRNLVLEKDRTIEKQSKIIESIGQNHPQDGLAELIQEMRNDTTRKGNVKITYIGNDGQYMQKLSNGTIILLKEYGETCIVSIDDAQKFVNEFAASFRKGKLMLDPEHNYLLIDKGIDITKINYKPMESIEKVHLLDDAGVESLYNSLLPYQKDMLKTHIFNMFSVKSDYMPIDKIRLLNKLSKKDYKDSGNPYFKELATKGGYKFLINKLTNIDEE